MKKGVWVGYKVVEKGGVIYRVFVIVKEIFYILYYRKGILG